VAVQGVAGSNGRRGRRGRRKTYRPARISAMTLQKKLRPTPRLTSARPSTRGDHRPRRTSTTISAGDARIPARFAGKLDVNGSSTILPRVARRGRSRTVSTRRPTDALVFDLGGGTVERVGGSRSLTSLFDVSDRR